MVFQYVKTLKYSGKMIKMPMSDGYLYYAVLDNDGLPTFYRRTILK